MARRSDHSREELYELALDAAAGIISKEGYSALTARRVATDIGYSPGTLYNLFANLEEMIFHLKGRVLDALFTALSKKTLTGNAEEDVMKLFDEYLAFFKGQPEFRTHLFEPMALPASDLPDWYRQKITNLVDILETALAPLFPAGTTERAKAAHVLWAGLYGISSLDASGQLQLVSKTDARNMAKSLATNFLAGLATDTHSRGKK